MPTPNYSVVFSAQLVAASTVSVGKVLIPSEDTPTRYVVSTTANRGTRRSEGIAITAYSGSGTGSVQMQQSGTIDATTSGLAAGSASWVRCSATGTIERVTPSGDDDIIGYAEADGRVHLAFGTWDADNYAGGSGATPGGSVAGVTTPEVHEATGDGVANDTAALEDVAADFTEEEQNEDIDLPDRDNVVLHLGARTYLTTGINPWPMGLGITGQGPKSVLATVTDAQVLLVHDTDADERDKYSTFQNFRILGNSTGTDQNGIEFGYLGADGTSQLVISRVIAQDMGGRGFSFYAGDEIIGPSLVQCEAANCADGYYAAHAGTMTGCKARDCDRGLVVAGGNVNFTGGQIIECTIGVEVIAGGNDAHGIIAGTHINHCGTAVKVGAITNAMQFSDVHIYEGVIEATGDGTGGLTHFDGGEFDPTAIECDGAGMRFTNSIFDTAYGLGDVLTTSNGGWCEFVNCRKKDGTVPPWIAATIRRPFEFASDADDTLTAQESVAEALLVTNGTISAKRKITSFWGPAAGRQQMVCNYNDEDVDFAWSSGDEVTVPTDTWALIIGLEGNAEIIAAGTLTGDGPTPSGPSFDPASLAWSLWFQAPYGGSGWAGIASAGASSGRNLTTLTNAPDVGAALGGHAGADCDGVDQAFAWSGGNWDDIATASAYTYIFACVPRSPAAPGAAPYEDDLFVGEQGAVIGCGYSTSGFRAFHDDGAIKATAGVAAAPDVLHTVAVRYNGTSIQIRVDGGAWTSVPAGNATSLGAVSLQLMKNFATNYANGVLYEVMTSQSALSDGDIADVETYLVDRYS